MKHNFPTPWDLSARVHVHKLDTTDVQKLCFIVFKVCKHAESGKDSQAEVGEVC